MALDAAGTSLDDLLRDATRRRQALDSYESSRRKQLEEFEAHKSQENAQIEAEMERLRARYAERIQKNREQVEQEKAALHNRQGAMQHESQRISGVIELCQKQPSASAGSSLPGTTGSNGEGDKSSSEKLLPEPLTPESRIAEQPMCLEKPRRTLDVEVLLASGDVVAFAAGSPSHSGPIEIE